MNDEKYRGVPLESFELDMDDEIIKVTNSIDWDLFGENEKVFKSGFTPMQPLRRIFGFLILEEILNLSGNSLLRQWKMIPYYQYFTGESWFHWDLPISTDEIENCRRCLSEYAQKELSTIGHKR